VEKINLEVDALVECKNMSIEALEHVSRILLGVLALPPRSCAAICSSMCVATHRHSFVWSTTQT
jgi:hypothetical protein